jgi:hypothetical protein
MPWVPYGSQQQSQTQGQPTAKKGGWVPYVSKAQEPTPVKQPSILSKIGDFAKETGKQIIGSTLAVGADLGNVLTPWRKPTESVNFAGQEFKTPSKKGSEAGLLLKQGKTEEGLGKLGEAALDVASIAPIGAGVTKIGKAGSILRAAVEGAKVAAPVTALYGATGAMQQDKGIVDVGKESLKQGAIGAAGGAVLGTSGNLLAKAIEKVMPSIEKTLGKLTPKEKLKIHKDIQAGKEPEQVMKEIEFQRKQIETTPGGMEKQVSKFQETKAPQIESAAVKPTDTVYEGASHAEAIKKAQAAGEDIKMADKQKEGMFKTTDGRLIDREQAKEEFGVTQSHEVPKLVEEQKAKPEIKETPKPVETPKETPKETTVKAEKPPLDIEKSKVKENVPDKGKKTALDDIVQQEADFLMERKQAEGGVENVMYKNEGPGSDTHLRMSKNPKWYVDFWKREGRAPNKSEMRDIARKYLEEGSGYHQELYDKAKQDMAAKEQEAIDKANKELSAPKETLTEGKSKIVGTKESGIAKRAGKLITDEETKRLSDESAKYTGRNRKKQAEGAARIFNEDIDRAKRILRGEESLPNDTDPGSFTKVAELYINKIKDKELADELAVALKNSDLASEVSEGASILSMRVGVNDDNLFAAMRRIERRLREKLGKNVDSKIKAQKTAIDKETKVKFTLEKAQSILDKLMC